MPEKPTLDGLESKWMQAWDEAGTYSFDRSATRENVFSIDTPPPTVSGSLHVGHVFSYTHIDCVARYQRMNGKSVFYPMGWDDNGLPTERRVQNYFGVRCDPSLPYDPNFAPPAEPGKDQLPISRRNFVELCVQLTIEDEKALLLVAQGNKSLLAAARDGVSRWHKKYNGILQDAIYNSPVEVAERKLLHRKRLALAAAEAAAKAAAEEAK